MAPAGVAPALWMMPMDSEIEVPAEITSSTISTRPRATYDRTAFTVVLGFLAVEAIRYIAIKQLGQRYRRGASERYAFVRRAE